MNIDYDESTFHKWFINHAWQSPISAHEAAWAGWKACVRLSKAGTLTPYGEKVLAKRQLDAILVQMLTSDGPGQLDYILANAGDLVNLVNHIKRLEWEHE